MIFAGWIVHIIFQPIPINIGQGSLQRVAVPWHIINGQSPWLKTAARVAHQRILTAMGNLSSCLSSGVLAGKQYSLEI